MADYLLARKFLEELAIYEKSGSTRDRDNLEEALAAIGDDPQLHGRVSSFYDPFFT